MFLITVKGFEPANSCIRHQNASTAPAIHICETGSLNWPQFMLQWYIGSPEFTEFPFNLGKIPIDLGLGHLFLPHKISPDHMLLIATKILYYRILLIQRKSFWGKLYCTDCDVGWTAIGEFGWTDWIQRCYIFPLTLRH